MKIVRKESPRYNPYSLNFGDVFFYGADCYLVCRVGSLTKFMRCSDGEECIFSSSSLVQPVNAELHIL